MGTREFLLKVSEEKVINQNYKIHNEIYKKKSKCQLEVYEYRIYTNVSRN